MHQPFPQIPDLSLWLLIAWLVPGLIWACVQSALKRRIAFAAVLLSGTALAWPSASRMLDIWQREAAFTEACTRQDEALVLQTQQTSRLAIDFGPQNHGQHFMDTEQWTGLLTAWPDGYLAIEHEHNGRWNVTYPTANGLQHTHESKPGSLVMLKWEADSSQSATYEAIWMRLYQRLDGNLLAERRVLRDEVGEYVIPGTSIRFRKQHVRICPEPIVLIDFIKSVAIPSREVQSP